jgi:putative PIN family toxin of toxin-antitoxin system
VRLVVDTNTIISGSLWQGPPARLISAALGGQARMFLSFPMLLELRETLQRPKFAARLAGRGETAESLTELFRAGGQRLLQTLSHQRRFCGAARSRLLFKEFQQTIRQFERNRTHAEYAEGKSNLQGNRTFTPPPKAAHE